MDDHAVRCHPPAQDARERWLHDLRNAVNAVGVTVALGRRMLDRGDGASAADVLAHTDEAWADCRALLAMAPEVLGLRERRNDLRQ